MNRFPLALLFIVGCSTTDATTNEVGITYNTVQDDLVSGTFDTQYGSVQFESRVVSDGVVDVTFSRGGESFGTHVDWNTLKADLVFDEGHQVTKDDRFLLKALSSALENDIGNEMPASDNLIRQSNLWGSHPEGAMVIKQIVADPERGWTKLCNINNYTFKHDASTHGLQSEYLACGRYETSNPCRDRCGPGCTSVGTSAWTLDCGNHDRCEQLHTSGSCSDELASASDDYTFSANCSY